MPKEQKAKGSKLILFLLLLAAAVIIIFFYFKMNTSPDKNAAISFDEKTETALKEFSHSKKETSTGTDEILYSNTNITAAEKEGQKPEATQQAYKQAATEAAAIDPFHLTVESIERFFTHLDNQDYFKEIRPEGQSKDFFAQMLAKLLNNPPKITRETDNLLSILQNAAHFYRIIGDKNIFLVKKIMAHEKELYEPVMADFYALICLRQECGKRDYPINLPLEKMYNYSVFFLNTLGGQAYLFRRDLTLRTLAKYYCVLVLDQANEKGLNHLGVDILYYLGPLIDEVTSMTGLKKQQEYLDTLYDLQEKYDKKYGN